MRSDHQYSTSKATSLLRQALAEELKSLPFLLKTCSAGQRTENPSERMLAEVDFEKMEKSPEKQLRDRVFTWVDIAVSKIRKCSKTAFYGRDDITPLFVSAYQRRLRQKYERKKAAEKVAAAATVS